MANKWAYTYMSDDVFMLILRADVDPDELDDLPSVQIMRKVLGRDKDADNDCPKSDCPQRGNVYQARNPRAWRGNYSINGLNFTIPSLYAFNKFFALVCDTKDGNHDSEEVKAWLERVNSVL